jgi:CHAT domain-containing protein/tetratricopeptide (TPR) repeat protein
MGVSADNVGHPGRILVNRTYHRARTSGSTEHGTDDDSSSARRGGERGVGSSATTGPVTAGSAGEHESRTAEPRPPSSPALTALRMVAAKPRAARQLAGKAREAAAAADDGHELSLAEEALGLSAKQLHEINTAVRHLRRAVSVAEVHGLATRSAEARTSLSIALAWSGRNTVALHEADRAAARLTGEPAARLQMHRATVLQRLGRLAETLEGYRQALAVFRRSGDRHWEAHLLSNRGVLHAYRGEFRAAEADLLRSETIRLALGEDFEAAKARSNHGFVAARRGDIPTALDSFDQAKAYFDSQGVVDAVGMLDRCEALLSAHLVDEARMVGERAVAELAKGGMGLDLPEARLMLSHAALLDGDVDGALQAADLAVREFTRQRRTAWAALARHAKLRARWVGEEPSVPLLRAASRTRSALVASGWVVPALDARLMVGRIALALGDLRRARTELALASQARYRGPIELRARAWHAEALLRRVSGDRRGASGAVRAGLRMLEQHRTALGSTELRAHVTAHAEDLATLGLRLAAESRRPERLFVWAERWRATSLRLHPVRPPDDGELAAAMARLRQVVGELERVTVDRGDTAPLLREQAELEHRIRNRMRHARGPAFVDHAPPSLAAVQRQLGDRVLVEMVNLDDRLHAVAVDAGRATLHDLAAHPAVQHELVHLRSALRRLAHRHGSARSLEAAAQSVDHGLRRLDELLMAPVRGRIAGRPVVMVPTGALHALPWPMLPSLATTAVTVSPSATFWCRAEGHADQDRRRRIVLIAGPNLPHAALEVEALARDYRTAAERIAGPEATVGAVKASLNGAGLAHLAAHGVFRADNPLFSSIELADGHLAVYDLEALERTPRTMVLSACDSGLSSVHPGDEIMGLAATLFRLGTCALIASVIPVPDDATRALMLALHDGLRRGRRPADALARAQARIDPTEPDTIAARAGFVCFGSG